MSHFWEDGLSVDESRVSVLIISLLSCLVVAMYSYITTGDLTDNMLALIQTLIAAVAGINIASSVVNYLQNNGNKMSHYSER